MGSPKAGGRKGSAHLFPLVMLAPSLGMGNEVLVCAEKSSPAHSACQCFAGSCGEKYLALLKVRAVKNILKPHHG